MLLVAFRLSFFFSEEFLDETASCVLSLISQYSSLFQSLCVCVCVKLKRIIIIITLCLPREGKNTQFVPVRLFWFFVVSFVARVRYSFFDLVVLSSHMRDI